MLTCSLASFAQVEQSFSLGKTRQCISTTWTYLDEVTTSVCEVASSSASNGVPHTSEILVTSVRLSRSGAAVDSSVPDGALWCHQEAVLGLLS